MNRPVESGCWYVEEEGDQKPPERPHELQFASPAFELGSIGPDCAGKYEPDDEEQDGARDGQHQGPIAK